MPAAARPSSRDRPEAPAPPAPAHDLVPILAPLIAALAGVLVFHRVLAGFFSQDDFLGLARAGGLAPRLAGAWRYLSHQAFFDFMRPIGGLDPFQYHLMSLAAHAATAALLWKLLASRTGPVAALVGAVFFAVHPAAFTALYWISAVGDILALLFALVTLMLAERHDRWRWLALPAFALSLLAKESTLLLPFAMLVLAARRPPRGRRNPALVALVAVAVMYLIAFVAGNAFGVREALDTGTPYALGWGANLFENALTYLGWTANFLLPTVSGFGDAVDPDVYPWGIAALVLWLAGLAVRPLRERGWGMAGALWLTFVLPLLPLRNHTYHYYLYAPLAGAAWCVAAAFDAALAMRARRRPAGAKRVKRVESQTSASVAGMPSAWAIAGAVAALLTLNGYLLVAKIENAPFLVPELRADPTIDRARIARNVVETVAAAGLPPGVTLRFWSPTASSIGPRGEPLGGPAPQATYWETNVQRALLDGLALRVMVPQVERVAWVREFTPAPDIERYAVYRPDGLVRVVTSAEVDSILRMMAADTSATPGR